jgi:hypothetical protein
LTPRSPEQIKSVVFATIPKTQVACQMGGSWWSKSRNRYCHVLFFTTWQATAPAAGSTTTGQCPTRSIQWGLLALPVGRNERQGLYRGQSRSPAQLFMSLKTAHQSRGPEDSQLGQGERHGLVEEGAGLLPGERQPACA